MARSEKNLDPGRLADRGGAAGRHDNRYPQGVATVLAGGLCLSCGGLILRHMEAADGWQITFYRAIGFLALFLVYLAFRYRGGLPAAFRAIGWPGLLLAATLGISFSLYVFAILLTSVANAVFTLAIGPFAAAALGWLLLGERVGRATWLAMLAALCGVGLMFADGLTTGRWLGNVVALGAPILLAVGVVIMRRHKDVDMTPATCLAGVFSLLLGFFLSGSVVVPLSDVLLGLLLGSVQLGLGFLLLTLGARSVPAGEVPLFALTETIFAPIWVWLVIDETPSLLTLAGGAVVLVAVAFAALVGLRSYARGQ